MTIRLSIIGAGEVGTTIAYAAAIKGLASKIILIDTNHSKAIAQANDLMHGSMFLNTVDILAGSVRDCRDSDVVVITAGAKQALDQSRLQLAEQNISMIRTLVPEILHAVPEAILLVVSNPVDVLTHTALLASDGIVPERIIGSGTVLDTSRIRNLLARRFNISVTNVHANIVGEHGDSEVPLWSSACIGSTLIERFYTEQCPLLNDDDRKNIFKSVREAAASIIAAKGATNWAIGLAVVRILEAIDRDENAILTVSGLLRNYHGISDVCLSVPRIVGRRGLGPVVPIQYNAHELAALTNSAQILRHAIQELEV